MTPFASLLLRMSPGRAFTILVALGLCVSACTGGGDSHPSSPAPGEVAFRVVAQGVAADAPASAELIGRYSAREQLAGTFLPTVVDELPSDFDFDRYDVLAWIRPLPGPFGAETPRVAAVLSGYTGPRVEIEWTGKCADTRGGHFALMEIPKSAEGLLWRVRHYVPDAEPGIRFSLLATGEITSSLLGRDVDIAVMATRDEYVAFLDSHDAQREIDPALYALDYESETLVMLFGTEGTRRTVGRLSREGAVVAVAALTVLQFGPVSAANRGSYEAVAVPKAALAGVEAWTVVPDSADAIRCP